MRRDAGAGRRRRRRKRRKRRKELFFESAYASFLPCRTARPIRNENNWKPRSGGNKAEQRGITRKICIRRRIKQGNEYGAGLEISLTRPGWTRSTGPNSRVHENMAISESYLIPARRSTGERNSSKQIRVPTSNVRSPQYNFVHRMSSNWSNRNLATARNLIA